MLTTLSGADTSKADLQTIDLYRALCLLALGNTTEANKVIESMLMIDPLYRPDTADLPPRVRTAFTDARKRMLPALVQQRYLVARAAFEAKNYAAAAVGFQVVLSGLADPDLVIASAQPPLSDLKVLASGFHELASKATPPVEVPVEAPPPLAPPVPERACRPRHLRPRGPERRAAADDPADGAAVPGTRAAGWLGGDGPHHQRKRHRGFSHDRDLAELRSTIGWR